MFSVIELRMIRYSVIQTMNDLKNKLGVIDVESDDAVEISNDLMVYQNIVEKISDREDV